MKFVLFTFTFVPPSYFYFLLFYFLLKPYFYFCPFIFSSGPNYLIKMVLGFFKCQRSFYPNRNLGVSNIAIYLVWFQKIYFLLYTFESKSTNILLYFYFYLEVNSTILLLCTFYFKVTFSLLCPSLSAIGQFPMKICDKLVIIVHRKHS